MIGTADRRAIADVALANIEREFPHHEAWMQIRPGDGARRPRDVHPAFYGSFDWHSCVETHWCSCHCFGPARTIFRPARMRAALATHLTVLALAAEAAFFARDEERGNERPYGWGWLLPCITTWPPGWTPTPARWAENIHPVADVLALAARRRRASRGARGGRRAPRRRCAPARRGRRHMLEHRLAAYAVLLEDEAAPAM